MNSAAMAAPTLKPYRSRRSLKALELILVARRHAPQATMRSSAELCVSDACDLYNSDDFRNAAGRALDSLKYSVGVFSKVFAEAVVLAASEGW